MDREKSLSLLVGERKERLEEGCCRKNPEIKMAKNDSAKMKMTMNELKVVKWREGNLTSTLVGKRRERPEGGCHRNNLESGNYGQGRF